MMNYIKVKGGRLAARLHRERSPSPSVTGRIEGPPHSASSAILLPSLRSNSSNQVTVAAEPSKGPASSTVPSTALVPQLVIPSDPGNQGTLGRMAPSIRRYCFLPTENEDHI